MSVKQIGYDNKTNNTLQLSVWHAQCSKYYNFRYVYLMNEIECTKRKEDVQRRVC